MLEINSHHKLNILVALILLTLVLAIIDLHQNVTGSSRYNGQQDKIEAKAKKEMPPPPAREASNRVIKPRLSQPAPSRDNTSAAWRKAYYGDDFLKLLTGVTQADVSRNPVCEDVSITYYTERGTSALQALRTLQQQCK